MREQGLADHVAGRVQLGQRAALYCRVSNADQSCERQERDLAAFAERAGYEVIGTYKETTSGMRLDRAERRKVLALAQRREIPSVGGLYGRALREAENGGHRTSGAEGERS